MMFEDDFDLGKQVDLANEIKEMETKANNFSHDRYQEFSQMVLNSFKIMEQKFTEMESRFNKVLQVKNKEHLHTNKENTINNIRQKSVSVGKISAPPKGSVGKMSMPKHQPLSIKKPILKTKK